MASALCSDAPRDVLATKRRAAALWEADRARLMLQQPFLALLAMRLDLVPVIDPRLATAATDGRHVFVNARYLLSLSADERLFVLAHEVWHCAARHPLRRGRRDASRWNVAADHEVNALLQSQGMRVPHHAVIYPQLRGRNAEAVYDWLGRHPEQMQDRGPHADVHELAHIGSGLTFDPDFTPMQGAWHAWPARVLAAAQQIERQRGSLPLGIARLVDDIRKPTLPWPELLRRHVERCLSGERRWSPPNRRYLWQGLVLPALERQARLRVAVVIDSSGSTQPVLREFIGEVSGIISSFADYELRLMACDAAVHSDETYTPARPLTWDRLTIEGGGGTDLRPAFKRLANAPPRLLIVFTDGHAAVPRKAPGYPVIWAVCEGGMQVADWGEIVEIGHWLT
jgi:predicted metal-dependent peptidase